MNNLHLAVRSFSFNSRSSCRFCRLVGAVAAKFGQPQVVAEMIAGVMLGLRSSPALAGGSAMAFPWDLTQKTRDTQSYLFPISQLGLALYMFVVGMEFRMDIVQNASKSSIAVSVAGMVAPSFWARGWPGCFFTTDPVSRPHFPDGGDALPRRVHVHHGLPDARTRIIHFKKLTGTTMGTVALGAGAIDDATAWCLLAVVLASFDQNWNHAWQNIGGGVIWCRARALVVRPLLVRTKILAGQRRDAYWRRAGHRAGLDGGGGVVHAT